MRYEWILSYDDYVAAQKLYNKRTPWRSFYTFFWFWVLPLIAAALVLLVAATTLTHGDVDAFKLGLTSLWPFLFFALIYRFAYTFNLRRSYKRIFLNGNPEQPVYMDVDEERLLSGVPGSSEGKFFWPTIQRFAESKEIAILYISKRLFLMIPKNRLEPAAWEEMKAFLLAQMAKGR